MMLGKEAHKRKNKFLIHIVKGKLFQWREEQLTEIILHTHVVPLKDQGI